MNIACFWPAHRRSSQRRRRRWRPIGSSRLTGSVVRAAAALILGLAALGMPGCGSHQPGSVARGCQDLAASQGSAAGDVWGQVAADARGTPLGQDATALQKLTVARSSTPAYRTDLRKVIALCARAGITV